MLKEIGHGLLVGNHEHEKPFGGFSHIPWSHVENGYCICLECCAMKI